MLMLWSKAFNERTNLLVGLPMTHAPGNEMNPSTVKFTSHKGRENPKNSFHEKAIPNPRTVRNQSGRNSTP
jgi:hypothetical protein